MPMTSKTILARFACENIRQLSEPVVSSILFLLKPQSFFIDQQEVRQCLTWCIDKCIRETYCLSIDSPDLWLFQQVYLKVRPMLEVQITSAIGFNFFSSMVNAHLQSVVYYDHYMELLISNANPY